LSYHRASEAAPVGGAPTMTVCTNDVALSDLVEHRGLGVVAAREEIARNVRSTMAVWLRRVCGSIVRRLKDAAGSGAVW
jgi:hypothetical protein